MDTKAILHIVQSSSKLKDVFIGVFPSDRLPKKIKKYPIALIVNVDDHTQPGSHWLAVFIDRYHCGEFFDSYARHPSMYNEKFVKFLNKHCKEWVFNEKPLQSYWSTVCGQYCLFYLLNKVKGMSLRSILAHFTNNRVQNDRLVHSYINRHYPIHAPMHDVDLILRQVAKPLHLHYV